MRTDKTLLKLILEKLESAPVLKNPDYSLNPHYFMSISGMGNFVGICSLLLMLQDNKLITSPERRRIQRAITQFAVTSKVHRPGLYWFTVYEPSLKEVRVQFLKDLLATYE